MTLSNLEVESPAAVLPGAGEARRRGPGVALAAGAVLLGGAGVVWFVAGAGRAPEPVVPVVAIAQPAAPAVIAVGTPSVAPPTQPATLAPAPEPARASSAPPSVAPAMPASAAPVVAAVQVRAARPAVAPVPRSAPPVAGGADAAELARRAASVDTDLEQCRCGAAERGLATLAGLPGGVALANARRARLAACRPVDIDHRCVAGRLVEVE